MRAPPLTRLAARFRAGLRIGVPASVLCAAAACYQNGGAVDSGVDSGADGPVTDAAEPDAGGPCPGALLFTGGYEDWDSTVTDFDGIEFATFTQVEDPDNTAQTAPNGRVTLCVPRDQTARFDITQPEYLDLRYTMDPYAPMVGPFALRGLTPARAEDLYALELGVTLDIQAAHVLVALRRYPADEPAFGASASLGNAHAGAFTSDGTGRYASGDTVAYDSFVLFANVEVGGGTTAVDVTAPLGHVCLGPSSIALVPGALAATTFACVPQ